MIMKTLAILLMSLTAVAADSIGPTVTQTITNAPTRRFVQLEVLTTTVVERKTIPVFALGKTNWITSERVLSSHSVTNSVERGGRPNRP